MKNKQLFLVLFSINFLITLGFGISDVFFSVYVYDIGARGAPLAVSIISYSCAKIIFSPLMGRYSDQYGSKSLITLSLSLYLFVAILYLISTNLSCIAFARLLQGTACAMFRPVIVTLVSDCISDKKRSSLMGTFDISFYGALALGPILGGALKDQLGFHAIFIGLVFLCILALSIALIWVSSQKIPSASRVAALPNLCDVTPQKLRCNKEMFGLLCFIFGRTCCISMTSAFLPILLLEKHHLSGTQIGIVMAMGSFIITLLLRPMGQLADRSSYQLMLMLGGFLVSLIYFLIPNVASFPQIVSVMFLIGLFSVVSQPACSAMLIKQGRKAGMGKTVGTFNTTLNLGFVAGPLLGASLLHQFDINAVFYGAGVTGLFTMFLSFIFIAPTPQIFDTLHMKPSSHAEQ